MAGRRVLWSLRLSEETRPVMTSRGLLLPVTLEVTPLCLFLFSLRSIETLQVQLLFLVLSALLS